MTLDPGLRLLCHPRFRWSEGMRDRVGRRVMGSGEHPVDAAPDLVDPATAGCLLGYLSEACLLTDVVRIGDEWVVAIRTAAMAIQGYAGETIGEAAAWALLASWGDPVTMPPGDIPEA